MDSKTGGATVPDPAPVKARKPRTPRPDATTLPGFTDKVRIALSERLGGMEAAANVVDDPAFAVVFRTCFDIRKSVGNPVSRAVDTLVNVLATQQVAWRMRAVDTLADAETYYKK